MLVTGALPVPGAGALWPNRLARRMEGTSTTLRVAAAAGGAAVGTAAGSARQARPPAVAARTPSSTTSAASQPTRRTGDQLVSQLAVQMQRLRNGSHDQSIMLCVSIYALKQLF